MDKNTLEQYIKESLSLNQIARQQNVSASTVAYWLKKYGLKTQNFFRKRGGRFLSSAIFNIEKDELVKLVNESKSIKEVIEKLGLNVCVYQYKAFKYRVLQDQIDISNLKGDRTKQIMALAKWRLETNVTLEELLKEESRVCNNGLKKKLVKENLLKYECAICKNNGTWENKPITLQLDHINGLRTDNRLENLRFLCPNCHSQTPTWGSKRRCEKIERKTIKPPVVSPSDKELEQLIWQYEPKLLAKHLKIGKNTLYKILKQKNISLPPKRYWAKRKKGQTHEQALAKPPRKIRIKKFTDIQVIEILQRIMGGESLRLIAQDMGTDHSLLSGIKLGKYYPHIPRPWGDGLPPKPKWTNRNKVRKGSLELPISESQSEVLKPVTPLFL